MRRGFGDLGIDHYIDNDGFHEFVGHSDLFDDFLRIIAFLC